MFNIFRFNTFFRTIVSTILIFSMFGCATDQQRTVTGGTVIGAGVGAVAGGVLLGVLGAAAGHRGDQLKNDIVGGAIIGAAVGGMAGYNWGKAVARKKLDYKNTEDYLDACIADSRSLRSKAQAENNRLEQQIVGLNQKSRQLKQQYNNGQASKTDLANMSKDVAQRRKILKQQTERIAEELNKQKDALAVGKNDSQVSAEKLSQMRKEIQLLTAQKSELQMHNAELQKISARMGA